MATAPIYVGTPKSWHAALYAANTNRDGTGTIVSVVSGGTAPGSRIDRVRVTAKGTTTAGVIRLYLSDGTNIRLIKEILVTAITPSASVEVWSAEVTFSDGLVIPNGW